MHLQRSKKGSDSILLPVFFTLNFSLASSAECIFFGRPLGFFTDSIPTISSFWLVTSLSIFLGRPLGFAPGVEATLFFFGDTSSVDTDFETAAFLGVLFSFLTVFLEGFAASSAEFITEFTIITLLEGLLALLITDFTAFPLLEGLLALLEALTDLGLVFRTALRGLAFFLIVLQRDMLCVMDPSIGEPEHRYVPIHTCAFLSIFEVDKQDRTAIISHRKGLQLFLNAVDSCPGLAD